MRKHEPIRLIAVGDICPGDLVCLGFGTGTLMRSRGPHFALERARALLREGDIVLGNLEGVLSNRGADPAHIAEQVVAAPAAQPRRRGRADFTQPFQRGGHQVD